jgi:hypothetical protein
MCELVLLIVPVLEGDENTQVVCTSGDADACAGELCAELVVATGDDALLGAVNVEGRNRGVVRRLLGEVRDGDLLGVARNAVGTARGRRGGRLEGLEGVVDLPVATKELAERRVVGLAGLSLDVLEVLCEPEAQAAEQTAQLVVRVADADEGVGAVEVVPVLCRASARLHGGKHVHTYLG